MSPVNSSVNEITEIIAIFQDRPDSPHLASRLGVSRYVKMADKIKKILPKGKILDWGSGCGQMSYLLKNRGFEVTSYEVAAGCRPLLENIGQPVIVGTDPVKLPFPDASFDGVLSSGVLEHVRDDKASLKEISRILKTRGYFLIFMLPNKYSYVEFISDCLGRGDHPIKYSVGGIKRLLERDGFKVLATGYQNFFPYNLKGFPPLISRLYHRLDNLTEWLDGLFTRLPLFRSFSTNLWLVVQKR